MKPKSLCSLVGAKKLEFMHEFVIRLVCWRMERFFFESNVLVLMHEVGFSAVY